MTGVQFGEVLSDFLSQNEAKYKQQATNIGVPSHFLFTGFKNTSCNLGMSKETRNSYWKSVWLGYRSCKFEKGGLYT